MIRRLCYSTDFYVVPRGALSKDTCLTLASLEQYKNAWHLLSQVSLDMMMRRNNRLSWQLQSVILAAESRGLQFELIRAAKAKRRQTNFRTYLQRRIIGLLKLSLRLPGRLDEQLVPKRSCSARYSETPENLRHCLYVVARTEPTS